MIWFTANRSHGYGSTGQRASADIAEEPRRSDMPESMLVGILGGEEERPDLCLLVANDRSACRDYRVGGDVDA